MIIPAHLATETMPDGQQLRYQYHQTMEPFHDGLCAVVWIVVGAIVGLLVGLTTYKLKPFRAGQQHANLVK
ncbi:hypothetical protein LPJ53_001071 [Coemansia erecta]|uniref:Uncharacterized protein n=1 Tax=Coemansia erecta TaxID=147472 RepID=A0A9W7Y798_9FUNG|nr:hypothetical protein LPJ53_001071 [Coemansia erecta]